MDRTLEVPKVQKTKWIKFGGESEWFERQITEHIRESERNTNKIIIKKEPNQRDAFICAKREKSKILRAH